MDNQSELKVGTYLICKHTKQVRRISQVIQFIDGQIRYDVEYQYEDGDRSKWIAGERTFVYAELARSYFFSKAAQVLYTKDLKR